MYGLLYKGQWFRLPRGTTTVVVASVYLRATVFADKLMSLRIRSSAVKVLVTPLLGLVVLNSSNRLLSILLVHSLRVLFQVIVLLQHRSLVRKSNGHHHLPLVLLFVVELK